MARVLVALSGGVDSSAAAALLLEAGHEVVGATMKLWGGESDSGCCSVSDVEDARRVADRLGIDHHVFNFTEEFDRHVVGPYVAAHGAGLTPNPCVECNRHLKFDAFLARAIRLGFDAVATGHHARIVGGDGGPRLLRGRDRRKDQSYVLSCLGRAELERVLLPVGELTKDEVRELAAARGLSTARKPDSQEVCFIAGGSGPLARRRFLEPRLDLHPGVVVDAATGAVLGEVPAVELVTVGQRRGLGVAAGSRRFAVEVDVPGRRVVLGDESALTEREIHLERRTWTGAPLEKESEVLVQASAHGATTPGVLTAGGVFLFEGRRRVAPGQVVALYDRETASEVLGSGVASARTAA
ncbi:MAG TPA: tRNA 2-thiouridine(34) synthase MnmA [Acidimicrobiales bacterium]|nr:tRNA 2-thiouridine(34) synthase MnmA [Acidimicrobiales bacterium]